MPRGRRDTCWWPFLRENVEIPSDDAILLPLLLLLLEETGVEARRETAVPWFVQEKTKRQDARLVQN